MSDKLERLQEKIRPTRGQGGKLKIENTESYFISNSEEGVRGRAVITTGFRHRQTQPVSYDCKVDIRRGRVNEANLAPLPKGPQVVPVAGWATGSFIA